jgi:hypothetical protein
MARAISPVLVRTAFAVSVGAPRRVRDHPTGFLAWSAHSFLLIAQSLVIGPCRRYALPLLAPLLLYGVGGSPLNCFTRGRRLFSPR